MKKTLLTLTILIFQSFLAMEPDQQSQKITSCVATLKALCCKKIAKKVTDPDFINRYSCFLESKKIPALPENDERTILTSPLLKKTIWKHLSIKQKKLDDHESTVQSVAFNPDGSLLACAGGRSIQLRDASTADLIITLSDKPIAEYPYQVKSIKFTPDGSKIVAGYADRSLLLWDLGTQQYSNLPIPEGLVHTVAISPDGNELAAGTNSKNLYRFDLRSGKMNTTDLACDYIKALDYNSDGSKIVIGTDQSLIFFDPKKSDKHDTQIQRKNIKGINDIAYNPSGSLIAAGTEDKKMYVIDASNPEQDDTFKELTGHTDKVLSVAWHPEGILIASASGDQTIRLWDPSNKRCIRSIKCDLPVSVKFHPNGKCLAVGSRCNKTYIFNLDAPDITQDISLNTFLEKIHHMEQPQE